MIKKIKYVIKKFLPDFIFDVVKTIKIYLYSKNEFKLTNFYSNQFKEKNKNNKVVLVFLIYMPEVWNSLKSVYETASKDERFITYLIAQPIISNRINSGFENPAYDYLHSIYTEVISAYDGTDWINLENYKPDYVFYTRPYETEYYKDYRANNVRKFAKVCLIPYGYEYILGDIWEITHNVNFIKSTSIFFNGNISSMEKMKKRYYFPYKKKYLQLVYCGFPRFDLINRKNVLSIPNRVCVMWTPRWTLPNDRVQIESGFMKYIKDFLDFINSSNNIFLIIRPHPLMFDNYIENGIMSENEVTRFKQFCSESTNIQLDEKSDYLESIKQADIFVTDFSSLLAEFFVTGKPIIYCDSSKNYTVEGAAMNNCIYHAENWKDIRLELGKLILGNDDLEESRKSMIKQITPFEEGEVSINILRYIYIDYTDYS